MSSSEIRKDYFKDKYVIISPNRSKRPQQTNKKIDDGPVKICFFCPQNLTDENIQYQDNNENGDWEIISIINKFSALSIDNPHAYGQCEVIIETRKHGLDINDFSIDHIVRVFDSYINRYEELKKLESIKYVTVFKNEGGKAGASIAHTHSQVIALPLLPPKVHTEIIEYGRYRAKNATCPYCDIILHEQNGPRSVWENEHLFVVAPYASEFAYETWLIPKRHAGEISDLTRDEKESYASALKFILQKLDNLGISYNYFIENAVDGKDYHTHIKVEPRPNIWAGLELGTGIIINPVAPEDARNIYLEQ